MSQNTLFAWWFFWLVGNCLHAVLWNILASQKSSIKIRSNYYWRKFGFHLLIDVTLENMSQITQIRTVKRFYFYHVMLSLFCHRILAPLCILIGIKYYYNSMFLNLEIALLYLSRKFTWHNSSGNFMYWVCLLFRCVWTKEDRILIWSLIEWKMFNCAAFSIVNFVKL